MLLQPLPIDDILPKLVDTLRTHNCLVLTAPAGAGKTTRVQPVTSDLASFWKNTYPIVRGELRRRYPKHAWPEDPYTAIAERKPTRKRP